MPAKTMHTAKFTVSKELAEIIQHHPFFNGVRAIVSPLKEVEGHPELMEFEMRSESFASAQIIGFSLADKHIPYEMVAKKGEEFIENLRVQYDDKSNYTKIYESHKIDVNSREELSFLRDPDDAIFVEDLSKIPMLEKHEKMLAESKEAKQEMLREKERALQERALQEAAKKPLKFTPGKSF